MTFLKLYGYFYVLTPLVGATWHGPGISAARPKQTDAKSNTGSYVVTIAPLPSLMSSLRISVHQIDI